MNKLVFCTVVQERDLTERDFKGKSKLLFATATYNKAHENFSMVKADL